jgi:TPR repeat protein
LGEVYLEGVGLPQNYLDAHMWFNLSGSQGNKKAIKNRNRLERKMSPEHIGKAQKNGKKVDAK